MREKLNKDNILQLLSKSHAEIKTFGVKEIGLFGSFLHLTNTDQSDIDILVEFEPGKKTFKNFMGLLFFLEDIFAREIDLITVESLSPHIGPHIIEEVEYAAL